jgi:uncharacterized ferritin-like protein (DUF455 family)
MKRARKMTNAEAHRYVIQGLRASMERDTARMAEILKEAEASGNASAPEMREKVEMWQRRIAALKPPS